MIKEVIAIFDIGKTNKKVILFDYNFNVVYQREERFNEILDDDGFACDDIVKIEKWIDDAIEVITNDGTYIIKAVNFSTYGASLIYLDEKGERITPLYNYLKQLPKYIIDGFYSKNGGLVEFSRKTASPALGFLNSGLQIKWLEKEKPHFYNKVKDVIHFPQYLSYNYTNKVVSEPTSIGCHTGMWDFDNSDYHKWVKDLDVELPNPISNSTVFDTVINGKSIKVGVGIHDSSAALVPYLYGNKSEFILISTGTWCITMNPFNSETLTQAELDNDCLCFLTAEKEQVKTSRLFMGYIHEVNAKRLTDHFKVPGDSFKNVKLDNAIVEKLNEVYGSDRAFFKQGIPEHYLDENIDLSQFNSFEEAYHQLMIDLTWHSIKSIELVIPRSDTSDKIYITGGFANNDIYIKLLAGYFTDKKIYTSEVDNASALGAAVIMMNNLIPDSE
ncbi:MAG: FGGY family carbohydrate kinase, partial [Bacteroidota bacterium]